MRRRAALLGWLKDRLNLSSGLRVLDLGGGTGAASEVFTGGVGETWVVDPDPRKLARGRECRPSLRFVEASAEALPFGAGRFDRVVSLLSFHHFQDPARALAESRRVLAPEGSLTVCDIDPASGRGRLFRILHAATFRGRLRFLSNGAMDELLHKSGFVRVHREVFGPYSLLSAEP